MFLNAHRSQSKPSSTSLYTTFNIKLGYTSKPKKVDMYPPTSSSSSSSCSSSHGSIAPSGAGNLTRYGSAPGSLLTTAHYFSSCDTEPKPNNNTNPGTSTSTPTGLQRSSNYCFNNLTAPLSSHQFKTHTDDSSSLVRHNSSPAGFLNRLATASSASDNDVNFSKIGVSVSRGLAVYNSKGGCDTGSARRGISRLNSQLSFTKDCLSQITEESNDEDDNAHRRKQAAHSYAATANFEMGSWDDSNAVMFSSSPSKRAKTINTTDISSGFNIVDSQLQFGLAETALEMATMENLIDIPHDSVPCKVRAKRGFATHPRSIAERERRTRISGKLKKLQDLVPNMDKQTSYADMLDLAVEHIKGLQTQVQNLHKEAENCTCGCGQNM